MSRVKSKNTSIELKIRKLFYKSGLRYRVNYSDLMGKSDVYISKFKTAVFINGCFWHRHRGCKYETNPKSNTEYWEEKFNRNMERDRKVISELNIQNIKVVVIWECTIKRLKSEVKNVKMNFYLS